MSIESQFSDFDEIIRRLMEKINDLDRKYEEVKKILREIVEALRALGEILKAMNQKIDRNTEILQRHENILNEHTKILDTHTRILNEHSTILADHGRKIDTLIKDVRDIKVTLRRIVSDIEEEALEIVPLFLEKILGRYVPLEMIEVPNVIEIDFYGEWGSGVIVGECKNRIRLSGIMAVLDKARKYARYRPELKQKRFILIIYGLEYLDIAKEYAENMGIGIITPKGLIVEPRFLTLQEIEEYYDKLKAKIFRKKENKEQR